MGVRVVRLGGGVRLGGQGGCERRSEAIVKIEKKMGGSGGGGSDQGLGWGLGVARFGVGE